MKDGQKGARRGVEPAGLIRQAASPAGGGGWASKSGEDGEGWQAASPAGSGGGLPLRVARMVKERQAASPPGITPGRANGEERTKQLYI